MPAKARRMKYNHVVKLHEKAKNLGLGVFWNEHGWTVVPLDKMPSDDDSVCLADILFEEATLASLAILLSAIEYERGKKE